MKVILDIHNRTKRGLPVDKLKKMAARILKKTQKETVIIELAVRGAKTSRALNEHYRRKKYIPKVLAFPINQMIPSGEKLLGSIVLCPVEIADEEELVALFRHGLLHLLGQHH